MDIKQIDDCFSTAGQLRPEQIAAVAAEGYQLIVGNRSDRENADQPTFAKIADAKKYGISAIDIPMTSAPAESQIDALLEAVNETDGPILVYCRSGPRSKKLYASLDC